MKIIPILIDLLHTLPGRSRAVEKQRMELFFTDRTVVAAGLPFVTCTCMTAVCRIHKLGMQSQHGGDPAHLQKGQQPENIAEKTIDALQMDYIGLFPANQAFDLLGGQITASIDNAGDTGTQIICFGIKL